PTATLEMPDNEVPAAIVHNCNFYFKTLQKTAQVLYSGISRLPYHPTICVSRSSGLSISSGDDITIDWDVIRWASKGEHRITFEHNNAYLVIPVTGMYLVSYTVIWEADANPSNSS